MVLAPIGTYMTAMSFIIEMALRIALNGHAGRQQPLV
jgi:hypothetical protein